MAGNIQLNQVVLTSQTTSAPIPVAAPLVLGNWSGGYLQPTILVNLSSGASITYNIEVSGNDVEKVGYTAASAIWVPLSTALTGATASTVVPLTSMIKAIRANVTTYVSGTLTFQFIQLI